MLLRDGLASALNKSKQDFIPIDTSLVITYTTSTTTTTTTTTSTLCYYLAAGSHALPITQDQSSRRPQSAYSIGRLVTMTAHRGL